MKYLISPSAKQYKANLHCHSVISDGKKTPEELKEMYKAAGYSILAITDHEAPRNHSYLNDDEFITITGYEAYIRKRGVSDIYEPEIHLNLFARDPENLAYICYNPKSCKYLSKEEQDELQKVGSQKRRRLTVRYVNSFIKTAKKHGYIVSYNHPWWSMESEAVILKYDGCFSMEMCNYSSYISSQLEYNGALYDKMILSGKRIFCHSADDNHNEYPESSPRFDSFGGFTMIMPDEFTYESIFSAMEKGEMYSSMGPQFKEVSVEKNKIHIECSEVNKIVLFMGSKITKREVADFGQTINSADFEIDKRAKYVRVSIIDEQGRIADTRAYFLDEIND